VDGYGRGNSRSSSGDESRILRCRYGPDDIYSCFARRSRELWCELEKRLDSGVPLWHPCGVLWTSSTDDPYLAQTLATLKTGQYATRVLDRASLHSGIRRLRPETSHGPCSSPIREALARVPKLRHHGPFHLSLLTVNTHAPGFLAPDCPSSDLASTLLQSVSCTDFGVGLLRDGLERDGILDDTVIALMGDHTILPSPENTSALGPLAVGWFGKVYMALRYPGAEPRVITMPSYTPDMAPIILDVLNFSAVPCFAFGQSTLRTDRRSTVVAHHFQILGNRLLLESPALATQCSPTELETAQIGLSDQRLSACERERIVRLVAKAELANLPLHRPRGNQ
jgi:Sulfatase